MPAAVITAASLYPVRRYALRLGLVDRPGGHSTHLNVTPLGGGIGIWLGVVITFAVGTAVVLACSQSPTGQRYLPSQFLSYLAGMRLRAGQIWGLLGCGSILFGLGMIDDRYPVNHWLRLGIQFAVAALVVFGLGIGLTAFIANPWITKNTVGDLDRGCDQFVQYA